MNTSPLYTIIQELVTNFQVVVIPTDNKRPHSRAGHTIKHFWTTPPTQTQLDTWFTDDSVKSYAILCGSISGNLFVLDFDNKQEYKNFKRQFPKIAKTLTVKTRRGYHVYLRSEKNVNAQKIRGGDLQGEGTYAIGSGSIIEARQYTIDTHQPIYQLQTKELEQVLHELRLPARNSDIPLQQTKLPFPPSNVTPQKLIKQFQTLAPKQGRNKALYQVANTAHALKIPLDYIKDPLSRAYVNEKAQWNHAPETRNTRLREAERTLESAYRNKKAKKHTTKITNTSCLPTAVREEMLKATASKNKQGLLVKSSTIPGRLLEALLIEGIKPEETFTIREAQEIGGKYKISTRGIYQVLRQEQGKTPTGERLFRLVNNTPYVREADKKTIKKHYNSSDIDNRMPFSDKSTPEVRTRGRQTQFMFVMPSIEELCSMYKVIPQSWDDLNPSDLMSAKAYKEAIHREYVRRVAPEQSVTYMANRLGCHPRSIYRYDKDLHVQRIPIFGFTPLSWVNVDDPSLYSEQGSRHVTPGQWLQREDGNRYPALKGIALRRLALGERLIACERRPSKRLLSPTACLSYHVIWRRADLPVGEWDIEGSAYELPAFGPDIRPTVSSHQLAETRDIETGFIPVPTATEKSLTEISIHLDSETASQSQMFNHPILNATLTLVSGIGESRRDKLLDLGIVTLSDLVQANPQQLASASWYGGYVTLHTIIRWQTEAAILLGWREPDPKTLIQKERQQAIQTYRKYLKGLMKFVDKTFTLINGIVPIEDLPEIEPTRTYLKLKSLDKLCKQKDSMVYKESRKVELHELACNFFIFSREYIDNMQSLQDWELEEYGFGDRAFWKRQYRDLERQENHFFADVPQEA